jgi:predicted transcriptional regulator
MTSSATSRRSAAPLARIVELRVGDARDALDRFEAAWNRRTEGRKLNRLRVLSLQDLPLLLGTLTPARWQLLDRLRAAGPSSIYRLAKLLGRDYKNVHTDVGALVRIGLVDKQPDARVSVPWDIVRAEL